MNKPVPQRPLHSDVPAQPGDMVFSVDSHGRFIAWNDAAAEAFGYSWEDIQGVPFDTLFPRHGSGPDRARFDLDRVMAGTDFSGGFSCRRKGGARLEIYLFATAGRDDTGGIVGAFCLGREVTAFWEAGQSIRASEAKFQTLFALSPDVIVLLDSRGRFLEVNEAGAALTGYSQAELANMIVLDLVPPAGRGAAEAAFSRIRRRQHIHGVVDIQSRVGSRLKFEYRASLLRLEDQAQVLVVGRDATERLRAEERLRVSEERFRATFESSRDGLFLETLDGRIVEANQRAAEILGYRREQLLELNAGDLVPPETRAWLPQVVQTLLRDGRYQAESINLHKSGAEIPVEISASLVEGAGGATPLALIAIRDITGRRAAQQRLRQSAESFRALAENANDGILITTGPGRHVFANRRAAEIMGRTVEQLLGAGIADLAAPEELPALMDRYERRMRGEAVPSQYETRIVQPAGRKVPIELTAAKTVWQGEPADLVVVRDISERKRVEEELREMAEAAMGLVRLSPGADILEFAAQSLARLVPGAIVAAGAERVESVVGLPQVAEEQVAEMLGRPFTGMEFERDDPEVTEQLALGRLIDIPGGLCGALLGRFPEQACRAVEDLLGTEGAFAIGLRRGDRVLGNVFILPRRGTRPDAGVVEAFASQASVALDRQQAERAVRESERRLATLMANLPGIAYRCANDPDWTMEYVSQGSLALTGYRPDELANNRVVSFGSLIHAGDRDLVWREVQTAVEQRGPYELTYRLVDREGRERWAWERGQGVFNDTGELVALEGFITDISERRRAELTLGQLARAATGFIELAPDADIFDYITAQLAELVPGVPLAVDEYDEANSALRVRGVAGLADDETAALTALFGARPDATGFPVDDAIRAQLLAGRLVDIPGGTAVVLAGMAPEAGAEASKLADRLRFVSLQTIGLRRRDRIYGSIVIALRDGQELFRSVVEAFASQCSIALERREAIAGLVASEERYSSLFNRSPIGMYRTTPDGRILMANPVLIRLLGYESFENLVSRNLEEARFQFGYDRAEFRRRIEEEGEIAGWETTWTRADGSEIYVRENARLVRDDAGRPAYYEGTVEDLTERRRMENEVWQAKERLRTLQDNVPVGLFRTTPEGTLVTVNRAGVEMFGYDSAEEMRAAGVAALYADPAERQRLLERLMSEGRLENTEFHARRKDGSAFSGLLNVTATFDEHGTPRLFDGVVQDVSARKQAEAARQEVEQRYRQVVERALDGIVIVKNGRIVYTNPAAARMVGRTPGDLDDGSFLDYIAPEFRPLVAEQYRRRMAGEDTPDVYEAALWRRDGRSVEVEIRAAVVDHLGEPADLAFIRDISQQKVHREELAESEERYRSLVEQAPDGIAVHQGGIIMMVNPAVARTLGFERPKDLVGRKVLDFVHPDDRATVIERMRSALEQGEPAAPQEERFIRNDGTPVWVEASASPFSWEGRPAVRVVVRDIDRRRRAERSAEEQAAMLQMTLDFSPHGFAVIQDDTVVLVNRAWARELGYDDPAELVGENPFDRVHPDDLERAREGPGSEMFKAGEPVKEVLRLRRRDGSYTEFPALVNLADWRGRPALFLMARFPAR